MSEYTKRDHTAQGEHYLRHVSAMTGEGLHTKSAIAGELAHRDIEIERLTDDYAAATHLLADRDAHIERLKAELATLRASATSVQADQRAEIDAANAELALRRKSGSASERLHNLCEGISKDADGSEWSQEEWHKLDADMLALRKELAAANAAAAWCDKHKPNGGGRGRCVICSGIALSVALSKISYLCGESNETECGPYDVHFDEESVIAQVKKLKQERDAANAVLDELIACKDLWESVPPHGIEDWEQSMKKINDFNRRNPLAWEAARALRKGTT